MDESFVHQAHGSAYSYFPSDDKGVVQDGTGRTTGKCLRMIMVHAITKHRPLEGFPIREGWFKAKENRAKKIKPGEADFEMSDEQTAEFLWQAKLATGDYHNAMTDGMFMQWLKHRLTPAFDAHSRTRRCFSFSITPHTTTALTRRLRCPKPTVRSTTSNSCASTVAGRSR
ncbi:unnamed protein product [Ectocarpus sp. CCAP 1310/34]|nr:unnamed protein product [Ectocarpus sp. CCAP 1310/34]